MSLTPHQINQSFAAKMQGVHFEHLSPVERITFLSNDQLRKSDSLPKHCYVNAINSAQSLKASHVVIGLVSMPFFSGLTVEHAWIKFDSGEYCDPTYQALKDGMIGDSLYYSLVEVPVNDYFSEMDDLNTNGCAIDFWHLRLSNKYAHLFKRQEVQSHAA